MKKLFWGADTAEAILKAMCFWFHKVLIPQTTVLLLL